MQNDDFESSEEPTVVLVLSERDEAAHALAAESAESQRARIARGVAALGVGACE